MESNTASAHNADKLEFILDSKYVTKVIEEKKNKFLSVAAFKSTVHRFLKIMD